MSLDNPDLKTFCPAPWFQIRNENNKDKKPCCKIRLNTLEVKNTPIDYLNTDELIDIKKKLHSGIKPKQCDRCWIEEDSGFKSQRQNLIGIVSNGEGYKKSWLSSYFKNKKDFNSDFLVSADIKIGNTCNFQCVMCKPDDSSMIYNDWIKRQDSEFVQEKLAVDSNYFLKLKDQGYKNSYYKQYVESIFNNTNNLLWLRLLGGEPLLDKNLLKKLKELPIPKKEKLQLSFITNGSINLKETLDYIDSDRFKTIQFNISLEGIEDVQEYARYGSNWKEIEKNILEVKDYKNNVQINLTYVIQTVTILRLHRLLEWTNKHDFCIGVSPCFYPEYLSLKTMPTELRKELQEKLYGFTGLIRQNPNSDEENGSLNGEQFIKFLNDDRFSYNELLFQKFVRYIKWYEEKKSIKPLYNIIPEWEQYLKI